MNTFEFRYIAEYLEKCLMNYSTFMKCNLYVTSEKIINKSVHLGLKIYLTEFVYRVSLQKIPII